VRGNVVEDEGRRKEKEGKMGSQQQPESANGANLN
jgi:hypothetical protein